MKLKGHTTIELANVKTGEVERYEDDNMFTQAIPQMINFCMTHGDYQGGMTNLYSNEYWFNLLGGLLLFDTPIDEGSLFHRSGNKMTGCASYNYANSASDMTEMGTYNQTESDTSQPLSKKFVWDFSTDQANGSIGSVCLTSLNGGFAGGGAKNAYFGWSNRNKFFSLAHIINDVTKAQLNSINDNSTTYGNRGKDFLNFCMDSENDLLYSFSVGADRLVIASHKMAPERFNLFQSMSDSQPVEINEYPFSFGDGNYFSHFYNTDEQVLYFWVTATTGTYASKESFKIYKFDMVSKTVSEHCTFTNTYTGTYAQIYRNLAVSEKAIYFKRSDGSNSRRLFKYSISSGENSEICALGIRMLLSMNVMYIYNGILTVPGGIDENATSTAQNQRCNDVLIDTGTDDVSYTGCSFFYATASSGKQYFVPPINNSQMVFGLGTVGEKTQYNPNSLLNTSAPASGNFRTNTFAPNNYLGTVNNLSQVVQKTPDKTMKISYVISAEEE